MSDHLFAIGARVQLRPGFGASFGLIRALTGTVVAHGEHELLSLPEIIVAIDGGGEETWHPDWWEPLLEPLSPPWCEQRALSALLVRE